MFSRSREGHRPGVEREGVRRVLNNSGREYLLPKGSSHSVGGELSQRNDSDLEEHEQKQEKLERVRKRTE